MAWGPSCYMCPGVGTDKGDSGISGQFLVEDRHRVRYCEGAPVYETSELWQAVHSSRNVCGGFVQWSRSGCFYDRPLEFEASVRWQAHVRGTCSQWLMVSNRLALFDGC